MSKKTAKATRKIVSSPEAVAAAQTFADAFSTPTAAQGREAYGRGCLFGACDRRFGPHSTGTAMHRGCDAGSLVYARGQAARKAGTWDAFHTGLVAQIKTVDPTFVEAAD